MYISEERAGFFDGRNASIAPIDYSHSKFQIAIARDRDTSHRYHATVHDTVSQFSYRYEVSNIKLLLLSSH